MSRSYKKPEKEERGEHRMTREEYNIEEITKRGSVDNRKGKGVFHQDKVLRIILE